jgi:acyl-CoA dehydrogenase
MATASGLTKPHHEELRAVVRRFANEELRPIARACDASRSHPTTLVKEAAKLGIVGPRISQQYGGSGADMLSAVIISEELVAVGASVGICLCGAATGAEMLEEYGTETQKRQYLEPITSGDLISAIAITEPNVGSDVASLETRAVPRDDGFELNGSKIFISNGSIAGFVTVLAKTTPGRGTENITAFIVPRGTAGFTSRRMETMGWRSNDTAEISLDGVWLPESAVVGQIGAGFSQVMNFFNQARVGVAANALGFAQGALEQAISYAKNREQFGRPVADFQGVRFEIAEMEALVASARAITYAAALAIDNGTITPKASSIAKLVSSKAAETVASMAFQIHGGYGYSPEFDIERFYRDARIMQVVEGTNEIQRIVISREALQE